MGVLAGIRPSNHLFSLLFRGSYQMLSGFLHPGSNLLHKYQHFAFFYTSTKYTLQSGAIANLIVLYKVIHFLRLFTEGNGYELVTKEVTSALNFDPVASGKEPITLPQKNKESAGHNLNLTCCNYTTWWSST